jgi:hypothetical protein
MHTQRKIPKACHADMSDTHQPTKEKRMDEILNKLLQSELLSEETKAEISEQWTTSVEAFKTQVREETSAEVRSELARQWFCC